MINDESADKRAGQTFQTHLKSGSTTKKWIILVLAILYLVSPIDLIPEFFVPIFGWLDDIGLLAFAASFFFRGNRSVQPAIDVNKQP